MPIWESLLIAFGGNAALLLVLGFLGRALIGQFLTKDIERYKAELDASSREAVARLDADLRRVAFEHEILHGRRAEILAEVYKLLMIAFRDIENFLHPMEWAGAPPKTKMYETAMQSFVDFSRYYDQRRIFLPHEVCQRLDAFSRNLRSPAIHLHSYVTIEYPTPETANEKYNVWHEGWNIIQKDLTAAREALEAEFRSLLGPTTGHATTTSIVPADPSA